MAELFNKKKKAISIKLDSWVHKKAVLEAKKNNRSFSNYIETLLLHQLKIPNAATIAAIQEIENGGGEKIEDIDSFIDTL